ncbi:conserved hypothetical protein [Ricinus communis]|uniref:Uncharacterized protein n=1 Tax=Ricinus communis TaxID=3988 RepID=B9S351_RICCO|nr:conserved hypothetical protein [Ricinus communis]
MVLADGDFTSQEDPLEDYTQALTLKLLKEEVNGVLVQSILMSPPLVVQSSLFHILECNLIG